MHNTITEKVTIEPGVVIQGAGIAGLIAAYELKKQNIPFTIIEASDRPGGRAQTVTLSSGTQVNSGANWLHGGMQNQLRPLLDELGIEYEDDVPDVGKVASYYNGKRHGSKFRGGLEKISFKNAKTVIGAMLGVKDAPMRNLAANKQTKALFELYQPLWIGTDSPQHSSARELLRDTGDPGGLQLKGGIAALVNRLVEEIGEEHIHYNKQVVSVENTAHGAKVVTADGDIFHGKKSLITASATLLQKEAIALPPSMSETLHDYLDGIAMGKMAKIVLEVDPVFFEQRPDLKNMHIDMLTPAPALMAHLASNGQPTIALLVGGEAATKIEQMPKEEALSFAKERLSIVEEVKGYEDHLTGEVLVTDWNKNPLIEGSFTALKHGHKRTRGLSDGNVHVAGEAFDTESPGTLAGAYRSGQYAAQQIGKSLAPAKGSHIAFNV